MVVSGTREDLKRSEDGPFGRRETIHFECFLMFPLVLVYHPPDNTGSNSMGSGYGALMTTTGKGGKREKEKTHVQLE